MRLAIVTSHPIQYYAPFFREIARQTELKVFFANRSTPGQQAAAGFGTAFDWDIDLLSGYEHEFLQNVAANPGSGHFSGCDTPAIGARLAAGQFDALLVMGWHLKSFWQAIWAAKKAGIRVMVRGDSHLDTPRNAMKRTVKQFVYPPLLRVFDAILYVGQRNLQYLRHYGYPNERLFFSPHCVDNDFFAARATPAARAEVRRRFRISENAAVALFAGKLVPFKRPMDLIEAAGMARAAGLDLHVLVAGSGELEADLRAVAARLQVPTHFMGFQNQSAMPAAYAASDFVVLPSGSETWGLVVNEAIASGRPVIVSDAVGCAPDLAIIGGAGFVFPLGITARLRDCIMHLIQNLPNAAALTSFSGRHSVLAATEGVTSALRQMVSSRPAKYSSS